MKVSFKKYTAENSYKEVRTMKVDVHNGQNYLLTVCEDRRLPPDPSHVFKSIDEEDLQNEKIKTNKTNSVRSFDKGLKSNLSPPHSFFH